MQPPDNAGKDVGEIVSTEPLGITATNSVEEIPALDADAVIYAALLGNPDEVAAVLRSGKNVVTPGAPDRRAWGEQAVGDPPRWTDQSRS